MPAGTAASKPEKRMKDILIGVAVFAIIFGGALFGMFLAKILPDQHMSSESRDAISGIGSRLARSCSACLEPSVDSVFDGYGGAFQPGLALGSALAADYRGVRRTNCSSMRVTRRCSTTSHSVPATVPSTAMSSVVASHS
jgi:hypothetical protein